MSFRRPWRPRGACGARWALLPLLLALLLVAAGRVGSAQDLANPIPADAASLERGRTIYADQCAICHGVNGRGDGPLARTMTPRPADFRVHLAEGHTEGQLFDWVSNGVPDTGMTGFSDSLSVEDRWHVVNYILTFLPSDR